MRNLLITILAVICLTSVHSQDISGTWNIDWQNNPYLVATACVPQSFTIVNVTSTQWQVTYTYPMQTMFTICPSVSQYLTDNFTNNTGVYSDTYGRNVTLISTYMTFTSNDSTVNGTTYIYQQIDPIDQGLAFGTLASDWINGTNTTVETDCCVPDVLSMLPSPLGSGLDLLYSATFYANNTCTTGVNSSNVNLTLSGSTGTTATWAYNETSVSFAPGTSPTNVIVVLNVTNNTCSYNYTRVNAPGPVLNNTWLQDWQSTSNPIFPAQYSVTPNNGTGFEYMTSQYTISSPVTGYVIQTGDTQYLDSSLGQNFTYDSATQTLLSGTFLYSTNGSLLSATPFVNFWGNPQAAANATCCLPTYVAITPGTSSNTLNVAYKLPQDYATNTACSGLTPLSGTYNVANTLSISQPSLTQLNWGDFMSNKVTGDASQITVTFNNNQCTFIMTPATPLPPLISTGSYAVAWQNNDYQSVCVPTSFTLTQDSYTQAVTVTYSYSSEALSSHCPANLPLSDTFTYNGTSNTFTDANGRSITFANIAINFVPSAGGATFFFQTTGSGIQEQSVLGGLGAAWNNPVNTSSSTGCCVPDTISLTPSPSGLTYSTVYTSTTCGTNVSDAALSLSSSNPTTISYVDNPTTINIQYTPGTSETSITVTLTPNTCVYTYQRVPPAGPPLNNTWIPDWQSTGNPPFPNPYVVTTDTTTNGDISYMTSNSNAVNSYVVQTGSNQYTDTDLKQTFTYDSNTGSFLVGTFLYSLTGSVLSPSPFIAFWGNAQATAGDTANCCIPTSINITTNPDNTLSGTYNFSGIDTSSNACQDFTTDIKNGTMEATLAIQRPSFTQLTYVDQYQFLITLNPNTSPPTLVTTIPSQCTFTMGGTTPPTPPNPKPKSGSWVSTKIMGLVMGLFMVLAWF